MRDIDIEKYSSSYELTEEILLAEGSLYYPDFEYNVFCKYSKEEYVIGSSYSAPYRVDGTPSFGLYLPRVDGLSSLMFKDLSLGIFGNCVRFVCEMCRVDRYSALAIISKDFSLGLVPGQGFDKTKIFKYKNLVPTVLEKPFIEIINKRAFTQNDLEYWNQYHISSDILSMYNIKPVLAIRMDGNYTYTAQTLDPAFDYQEIIDNVVEHKIYRPLNKDKKFRNYFSKSVVIGYEQLPEKGDILYIDASRKDVAAMRVMGFNAIAALSETTLINEDIISELKLRFKQVVVSLDNDIAGVIMAEKYKQRYGLRCTVYPKNFPKDKADLLKQEGIEKATKAVRDLVIQ